MIPTATFRFSIAALLLLTTGVAFVASALIETRKAEPISLPLIVKTLPLRGTAPLPDSKGRTPSLDHSAMKRLIEERDLFIRESLAAAITSALGDGTDDVVVSRVYRASPTEPFNVEATWSGSSPTRILRLQYVGSDQYRACAPSPDGSPDIVLMLDLGGTDLENESEAFNLR